MPAIGFLGLNGEKLTASEAVKYFENTPVTAANGMDSLGIIPEEVLVAMLDADPEHNSKHARVQPSGANPESSCRREIYLKRFIDYYVDPLILWEALEGTLTHHVLQAGGEDLDGDREIRLPTPEAPGVVEDPVTGTPTLEVWPGVFMSGRLDYGNQETCVIRDTKTSRYPKVWGKGLPGRDFGEQNIGTPNKPGGWTIQLNIYRLLWEKTYGKKLKHIYVWRMYRGSQERTLAWRKFEVPIVDSDLIWNAIGNFVLSTIKNLQKGVEIEESDLDAEAKEKAHQNHAITIPMDGYDKKIFHGQKCPKYCEVKDQCFKLAGLVDF